MEKEAGPSAGSFHGQPFYNKLSRKARQQLSAGKPSSDFRKIHHTVVQIFF